MPPALSSSPGLPPAPQHDRGAADDEACGAGSPRVHRIEQHTEHDIGRDTVGATDAGGTARVATVARPRARTRRPAHDAEARRACEDYLHRKGPGLRTAYAALCVAQWLERAGQTALCAADVRALYPRRPGIVATPLRDPAAHLRRASECGLFEALGDAWYALTPLGRAVVEALPDDAQVSTLLGRRLPPRVVSRVGV